MKVILLRDVAKIGRRSEIVELPDGYALNQLIPKKWAEAATPANLKKIETARAAVSAHDSADQERFAAAVALLQQERLTIQGQSNEQGHLFKAIHEDDVLMAATQRSVTLDKSWVRIATPIKSLGVHEITLKRGVQSVVCEIQII